MPHVQRNGVTIHYESFGRGTPIALLHPLSTNRYFWTHQIFALARAHRVIVLDHRGHGLSDKPADGYAIDQMAADLLAVLDDAGVQRAVLVGVSAGGMIALQAALDAPDRVIAALVASCGTDLAAHVPSAVFEAYAARFEAAFDFMLAGATSPSTRRDRAEVCALLGDMYRVQDNFTHAVFLACMRDPNGVFRWNVADRLSDIRHPVLVLAGQDDRAVPLEAVRALAGRIPGARLAIVPDVGHFYPLERPADFNAELRRFLEPIRP
jgi:pimeloyl-ACP methyl ester carboxylesterase